MIAGEIAEGHALGPYELLAPIASGGMATVWAARRKGPRGFQKMVALKVMLAELADEADFERMFLDEAELASRIRHPNVVEILDLGEHEGVLYQVMELIDGEPLHMVVREQKRTGSHAIPVALAVRIAADAAAGLHAAHELRDANGSPLGLVHRDVTPSNILVGYDGRVKVVDFGVAKAASNLQHTRIGQVKGKAPYMAPEQALGGVLDRRADVFSLGIVFYQLLTGVHPFQRDNEMATLRMICDDKPVAPPSAVGADLPEAVEAVVVRALAKRPGDRFETMADMLRALESALPVGERADVADLSKYLGGLLGTRGDKRRSAIVEAARAVDERRVAAATDEAGRAVGDEGPHAPEPAPDKPLRAAQVALPSLDTEPEEAPDEGDLPTQMFDRHRAASAVARVVARGGLATAAAPASGVAAPRLSPGDPSPTGDRGDPAALRAPSAPHAPPPSSGPLSISGAAAEAETQMLEELARRAPRTDNRPMIGGIVVAVILLVLALIVLSTR